MDYGPDKEDRLDEIEQEIQKAAKRGTRYGDVPETRPGPVFFARNDPAAADAPTSKFYALCVTRREGDWILLFDARSENMQTLRLLEARLNEHSPPEPDGSDADGLDVEWKEEDDDLDAGDSPKKKLMLSTLMKDTLPVDSANLHQWMQPLTEPPADFEAACLWADQESRGYAKVVVNCELDHAAIAAKLEAHPSDPKTLYSDVLGAIQKFLLPASPVHKPSFTPMKTPETRYHVEYHNYLDTGYRVHLIEARAENLHVVKRLLSVMKCYRADPDYKCGWMSTPEKPLTEAEARQEMVANGLGEVTTFDFLHGTFDEKAVKARLAKMTREEDDAEDEAVPFNVIEKRLWFKADEPKQ